MRVELRRLITKVGISALYVTHDQDEAFTISDKVIVMDGGRILQYASPDEIYNRPAHPFVASFIGHAVLLDGEVVKTEDGDCFVRVADFNNATLISPMPPKAVPGDRCKVVIRTSEIRLNPERFPTPMDNVLEGQMTSREFRGGLTDHRVRIGVKELVVTSHKLCPLIRVNGDGGKTFIAIDRSAISIILD